MTITYTWRIENMEVAPHEGEKTDVIKALHWRLIVVEGDGYRSDIYGDAPLGPAGEEFIPFAEIEEDAVIGWLLASLGTAQVANVQEIVAERIAQARTPKVVTRSVPWA